MIEIVKLIVCWVRLAHCFFNDDKNVLSVPERTLCALREWSKNDKEFDRIDDERENEHLSFYDHSFPAPTRDETVRDAIEVVYNVAEGTGILQSTQR